MLPDPHPRRALRAVLWPLLAVRRRLDATDARAVAEGWTVTKLPWGGRVYRDPRLDRLAAEHVARVLGPARSGWRSG